MANWLGEKLPAFSPATPRARGRVTPSCSGRAEGGHRAWPCCENTGKAGFSENLNTQYESKRTSRGARAVHREAGLDGG